MNFLPTTTFTSPILTWMTIATSVAFISGGLAILFLFITLSNPRKSLQWILGAFATVCLISSVGSTVLYESIRSDLIPQVETNLVSNLKQKYVINGVDYNADDYEQLLGDKIDENSESAAVSAASSKSQPIIVFAANNEKVLFMLTQDRATNEPTLSNYPYQASKTTVDDIARK